MMKFSKIYFFVVLFMFSAAGYMTAQTPDRLVDMIMKHAADTCVSVSYNMTFSSDSQNISDSGFVVAQGKNWKLESGSLQVCTAGSDTWIADSSVREVVIEPAWTYADLEAFYNSLISSGAAVEVCVTSIQECPLKDESFFIPSFDSDWIITDLR